MSTIISSATWLRRLHSESINWDEWVSAGRTRNYMLQDPVLDWFQLYGRENGFVPDTERAGYNPDTDFSVFIFDKGRKFEAAVLRYLESFAPISVIANEQGDSRRREKAAATFDAMFEGRPMISQGVFWDFDE